MVAPCRFQVLQNSLLLGKVRRRLGSTRQGVLPAPWKPWGREVELRSKHTGTCRLTGITSEFVYRPPDGLGFVPISVNAGDRS